MSLAIETLDEAGVAAPAQNASNLVPLSQARPGFQGRIAHLRIPENGSFGISAQELERRLLEIGFTEGAMIEVIHEGLFGRDPIVALVDGTRIALRRREAQVIFIAVEAAGSRTFR